MSEVETNSKSNLRGDEAFDLKIGSSNNKKISFAQDDSQKEDIKDKREAPRRAKNFKNLKPTTEQSTEKISTEKVSTDIDTKETEKSEKVRTRTRTKSENTTQDLSSLEREIKKLKRELRREQRASKSADKFEQEMKIQQAELDTVINSHVVHIQTDTNLHITDVSRAFSDMFGYNQDEIIGQDINTLVKNENSQKFYNGCEYVSSHGKESWGTNLLMLHNENKTLYTKIFIYPSFDAGVFSGFTFIIQDTHDSFVLNNLKVKQLSQAKYEKSTLDYMRGTSVAILSAVSSKISLVVKIISFIILAFFIWATIFDIEEIVKGDGQVIPFSKVKSIKNLEGGVVEAIYIKEGDRVKKGQLLLKLSDTSYQIKIDESTKKLAEIKIKLLRLEAQANNIEFVIDDDLKYKYPDLMRNEQNRYISNQEELKSRIEKLKEQLNSQISIEKDSQNSYLLLKKNYESRLIELKANKKLAQQGVFSKYDIANIQREVNTMLSQMVSAKEKINQTQNSINEIKNSIKESKLSFQNIAKDEYSKITSETTTLKETIRNFKDIVNRTYVRTPVDGTIKKLLVNTIDSSVSPSEELITIVPDNSSIISEIRITPENIGKLYVGQKVFLKITAFDYALYGNLVGKIINISPDTTMDPKTGIAHYIVQVRTDKDYLDNNKENKLKVGMKVNSDIIVGKKTILEFVLKPILKSTQK